MSKLTKRQFLKMCAALGIMLPLSPTLSSSDNTKKYAPKDKSNNTPSVIIIGAGAAGLTTGYQLMQAGISCQILEAAPAFGGRMKQTTTFTDFPIPLGAEWLHTAKTELSHIINDPAIELTTQTRRYNQQDSYGYFEDGELTTAHLGDFNDLKFINSTWFSFFEQFIVPPLRPVMRFNTQIVNIDHQGNNIVVSDHKGNHYQADKVVITVPLKILQQGDIQFIPALPASKIQAIQDAEVWGGIKVFLEFSEKFYPTFLETPDSETSRGQHAWYDAAYGQNTTTNILGLFAVGEQAKLYQALSGDALRDSVLAELDEVFEGIPSQAYIKHIVQNWDEEPFIHSAYLSDVSASHIPNTLYEPVGRRLFFAGDAYTPGDDWGAVHNATRAARAVVQEIIG
ncbi:MAG: flavin monoamine oxidase family protein [Thiolinea sp.]